MVIEKVYRVLVFEQKACLARYIAFNTTKKLQTNSDFEKDFYKLMVNSMFGKTQENLRNRVNVEMVTERERALKIVFQACI